MYCVGFVEKNAGLLMDESLSNSDKEQSNDSLPYPVYSTSVIENSTGISRATLRYYEEVGLINPDRKNGSGYRVYTNKEIGSIIDCTLLKNVGYSVADSAAFAKQQEQASCEALLDLCLQGTDRQKIWLEAVQSELMRLKNLYANLDSLIKPRLVHAEAILFFSNQNPKNDQVVGDDLQKTLFRSAPVSSTAELFAEDFFARKPLSGRWGRSLQKRFVQLFPDAAPEAPKDLRIDLSEAVTFEDGPQILLPFCVPIQESSYLDAKGEIRAVIEGFIKEKRLSITGPVLLSDYLPVGGTLYATLRIPVAAQSPLGKAKLARLPRE